MNKTVLHSDEDCVKLLLTQLDDDHETVEDILGIEFARSNGEFDSDYDKLFSTDYDKIEELESLEVDMANWRKLEIHGLPDKYPCVAVHLFERSFDRHGNVTTQVLEYVYQDDFTSGAE